MPYGEDHVIPNVGPEEWGRSQYLCEQVSDGNGEFGERGRS